MTEGEQTAESNIEVRLNGEESSAQIISRSVGKGNSVQTFHPKAVGNNKCQAHIQCDSIIMDHAEIGSIRRSARVISTRQSSTRRRSEGSTMSSY